MIKNKLIQQFKDDLTESKNYKNTIDEYIRESIARYNGESYGNEQKGKSKFISKDIFRQIEKQHALIKEPFVNNKKIVRLDSTDPEDKLFALQSEKLLNFQFTKNFNRYKFLTDLIKTMQIEGTAFIRVGWQYESINVKEELPLYHTTPTGSKLLLGTDVFEREKVLINKPTAIICRNEDIFIDPSASQWEDVQFVIHKTETSLTELKKAGIYSNLDQIEQIASLDVPDNFDDDDFDMLRDERVNNAQRSFNFKDKARKKLTMYEYWGNYDINGDGIAEPIVCCWINDTIIRLENNPYPDKDLPFIPVVFSHKPFSIYGLSMADILADQQKIKTGIIRGIIDDIAQSNSNQKGIRKGNLDSINKKRFLEGKSFEYNLTANDFYQGQYTPINSGVFNTLSMVNSEIDDLSNFDPKVAAAGSQALGNTDASKSGKLPNGSIREYDLVKNVAEIAIKPLLRKWLYYCYDFMEPEEVSKITGMQYVTSRDGSYLGSIVDFDITISTNQVNESKARELAFLMQTLGNNLPFELTKIIMGEMARLKNMDELAAKLEQFQPKPDPLTQQYKQLEIEKLKAEVMFKTAGAKENEADYELKTAKAQEARSKADLLDLDFTHKNSGIDYKQDLAKIGLEAQAKIKETELKEQMGFAKEQMKGNLQAKSQLMSTLSELYKHNNTNKVK